MTAAAWRPWGVAALRGIVACMVALAGWAAAVEPARGRQPVESFARLPHMAQVSLSPHGKQLAWLMNEGDRTLLVTRAVDGTAVKGVLSNDNQAYRIRWLRWVGNERLLVSVGFASRRDFVGTIETRLISVKSDGSGLFLLTPAPGSAGGLVPGRVRPQQIQDRVVDWMPDDGRHVLLALSEPEGVLPAVYKVNVETGERRMVKSPERHTHGWLADRQHRVRVALVQDGTTHEVRVADPDGKAWRTAWRWTNLADAVSPLGFGPDPHVLYVTAYHEGRRAVFSVKLDDPALPRTLQHARSVDVEGGLIRLEPAGEVIGVNDASDQDGSDRGATLWHPAWRAQLKAVNLGLPDRENDLREISHDQQRYLVLSSGNGRPGVYYLGDRRTGDLEELGAMYPELDPARLVGKRARKIQSRDGLALNAYLTLPQGRRQGDGGPPLSMVLLPHGGPHSRDGLGFDTWTEFLADRGHAVLQVNFRGSDGYGAAFSSAGLQRWGLEMQDDLTDAVQWAVAQHVADPARVCIVGASYGGYAALMGAVKTPELYRCVASFAGVSDLPDLIEHWQQYVLGEEAMDVLLGKWWGDRERLRATSPARHAGRIRAPVLLMHGTADRSVPLDQTTTMAQALRRANKPHRMIELDGGDHHLSRYTHRLTFFKALEAFLDEHLRPAAAGAAAAAPSAAAPIPPSVPPVTGS